MPLLEVNALCCSVRSNAPVRFGTKRKRVLDAVSLSVEEGTTVGLLGESGSGKSTLARCIAGLQQPDSGVIIYRGTNLFPQTANRKQFPLEIQMVFQASGASLDPTMTVEECLTEGIEAKGISGNGNASRMTPAGLLASVGIQSDFLTRYPSQLSGGERQRVAIARTLAAQPRLLMMDEPTSALDVLTQAQIISLVKQRQLEEGFSLLLITHEVKLAVALCDRIAILYQGRIIEEGPPDDLLTSRCHPYTQQLFADSGISS